jgi:hypothetical protein
MVMAVVSALVFAGALALVVAVVAGTLAPSWGRILAALAGGLLPQPRVAPARRHRIVRPDLRANHLAARRREAA